jgi:hypothetical protein
VSRQSATPTTHGASGSISKRPLIGDGVLNVVVRPMPPDCDSDQNLRAKLDLVRELGLARVDFYHYGLMRLDALDRIRAATSA